MIEYVELADRWIHFVAGVLWIGLLYFFNWVNTAFAPTMDAETKRKVVPELLPRTLFWFRWGALVTWLTGVILLFLVYYHGDTGYLLDSGLRPEASEWLPGFLGLFVGFLVYDVMFKALGGTGGRHTAGVAVWGVIAILFGFGLDRWFGYSNRAAYIHVAALFGTAMAANVWMRIWPAQRRIITAVKGGSAPDASDPAMAGLRSKHNTYMSVPLLLIMIGADGKAALIGNEPIAGLPVILVISFAAVWLLYAGSKNVKGF